MQKLIYLGNSTLGFGGERDDYVGKTAYRQRTPTDCCCTVYFVEIQMMFPEQCPPPPFRHSYSVVAFLGSNSHTSITKHKFMFLCGNYHYILSSSLDHKVIDTPNWQSSPWHAQDLSVKSSSW